MSSAIIIRKYAQTDKEALVALLRLNTPAYFGASEEEDFVYYLHNHAANHYVIELEDEVIGCGGFNFSDDHTVGKISWDIVHPQHQGKGFGSTLTRYRIEKMKAIETLKLISVRTSQLAYRFYEKLGFQLKEKVSDYWAKGYDMYRMEQSVQAYINK